MTPPPSTERLLAGPAPEAGAEQLDAHLARLGPLPDARGPRDLITELEASGLLGRGGAGFPVGRKWRALAERPGGRAVVVVNGAEGEPASFKDRTLMTLRPHLVIDGAILAAEAIDADEIVVYVGEEHGPAVAAMGRAITERAADLRRPTRLVRAPIGYVAGEASAAVHYINAGDARPTTTPPRISERGVDGRPDARPERGEPGLCGAYRPVRRALVPIRRTARVAGDGPDHDQRLDPGRRRPGDRAGDHDRRDRGAQRWSARPDPSRDPGRLLRDVGPGRGRLGPGPGPGGHAIRRPGVRVRHRRPAGDRRLRSDRDGRHHGLHGGARAPASAGPACTAFAPSATPPQGWRPAEPRPTTSIGSNGGRRRSPGAVRATIRTERSG